MKKIINGRLYNTETAKELGSYWNELSKSDFRNLSEYLYKKKNGEYFLYGEGGAMTKYSESNGNTTWGSIDIIPLTENEAKQWAEKNISADRYVEIFGDVSE